jgi:glycerophosphoryl diester phosphodiesterase
MNPPGPWRPIIVAHRGGVLWQDFAENSARAFAEQIQEGYINECDVHASSDGEAVVIHDDTLDRTTFTSGKVSERTAEELRAIELWTPDESRATIPLLKDVAASVSLVEIKPPDAPGLVRRIIQLMAGRDWTLISFDEANLRNAREIDPSVRVALVVDDLDGIEVAVDGGWNVQINHELLGDRIMGRFHDAGLTVGTWSVNEKDELDRVLTLRPDSITSDGPRLIRQYMRGYGIFV